MAEQIEIEINGQKILTEPNKMIIEVADEHNIRIPRFCYHKKLSVAANCRMCLVEVEKAPKTLPACATPIMPGMKVFTQSAQTKASQKIIMEFLLINHPLDCPICDQGGQCELQDFSMQYGQEDSSYSEAKRAVEDDDLGPLIATHMTRCIHCTRCVRFGTEIAGVREMGATQRGEHTQIGTYVKHTVSHELSGNIIDLCPVGALTAKPFEYKARPWELTQHASIAPHDGLGSHIYIHTRRNQVLRVVPKENEQINEAWLSDRDRFGYLGLNEERLALPMIKHQGQWHEVTWPEALNYCADALEKIHAAHGANQIAALYSPSNSLEEVYLLKTLLQQQLASQLVDYRTNQANQANHITLIPSLGVTTPAELAEQQSILLIGSHLRHELPLLAHRVRQAALKQAAVHCIDMVQFDYAIDLASQQIAKPSEFLQPLLRLANALMPAAGVRSKQLALDANLLTLLAEPNNAADEQAKQLAQDLQQAERSSVLLGAMALEHADLSLIQALVNFIAQASQSQLAVLAPGANARGCHALEAICAHPELSNFTQAKAYIIDGIEPSQDIKDQVTWQAALAQADCVIALSSFKSPELMASAQVLLPKAAFAETSGSFMNLAGQVQSFQGAVQPFGEARPAWKIYRVLANLLGDDDCNYQTSQAVLTAAQAMLDQSKLNQLELSLPTTSTSVDSPVDSAAASVPTVKATLEPVLELITVTASYCSDPLVRRAKALQEMNAQQAWFDQIIINPVTAEQLALKTGDKVCLQQSVHQASELNAPLMIDHKVPVGAVMLYLAGANAQSPFVTTGAAVTVRISHA